MSIPQKKISGEYVDIKLGLIINCHSNLHYTSPLLLDEIYYLIELPFDWLNDDTMFVCLLDELILGFCFSDFDIGNHRLSPLYYKQTN